MIAQRFIGLAAVIAFIALPSIALAGEVEQLKAEIEILKLEIQKLKLLKEKGNLENPSPTSLQPDKITIERAIYGIEDNTCDATGYMKKSCNGEFRCDPVVDNTMCGNPDSTRIRTVIITYRCGAQTYTMRTLEGVHTYIVCD